MKFLILSSILTFFFITDCAYSQPAGSYPGLQDSLSSLSSLIWKQKTDSARLIANEIFFKKFQSVLKSGKTAGYTFDSIYGITRIASENGNLRIFTWNVPLADGTNKYFGFVQFIQDSVKLAPLKSVKDYPADIESKQLTHESWYGAIYYKIIDTKIGEQKTYTLLGWDGYTSTSNRKIIDIIYQDPSGNIVLGMPVFKTDQGIKSRVVKEYSEKANMLLRYDYQAIMVKKKKKIKKEETWLIVMDRLIPMDPSLKGMPKYYVAAGDIYDGFIFRNGYWVLVEDIDVVNREKALK